MRRQGNVFSRNVVSLQRSATWRRNCGRHHRAGRFCTTNAKNWNDEDDRLLPKDQLVQIPDEKENILREGEWNTLSILAEGSRIQTWLNGEPMVDITDAKVGAGKGRIALQIHDGGGIKVRWRNLHIKTL